MKTYGIGIVGLGYWGPNLLRNFHATEGANVLYGCDLDEKRIAKLQAAFPAVTYTADYSQLLQDPAVDLIVVATRTAGHFPLAKQALEAGKHVFIEKPMTATVAEATELNKLAEEKGLHIFVDHTFAFAPAVEKMVEQAQSGALGDLLYFESTRINLGIIQQDTNVLWDLAVHDLSILSRLRRLDDVVSLHAHGSKHFGEHIEIGHLHLTFADGFAAHIHVSWLSPVKIRHTFLGGTKAMVTYDDTEPSEKVRVYDKGVEHAGTEADPFFPKYRSGDVLIPALDTTETLLRETRHVIACLCGDEQPYAGGSEGLQFVRILEKADESLRLQQPVTL